MALIVKDRVRETTTTTGTGTVTLGGAVSGFQSFSVIGNANTTYYTIVDAIAGSWEVGIGTYSSTGPTLSRTTILESSNSGSAVSFVANIKDVFVTYPAERSMYVEGTTITPATAATLPIVSGGTGATTAGAALTALGAYAASNPSDYTTNTGTVTSVGGTGTVNGISLSGTVTTSGNLTLGGALTGVSLTTQVSGTLPVANGGTGATTRQNALNALAGSTTSGQYLRGNGTDILMSAIQAADVPTLNQNTTGSSASTTGNAASATVLQTARTIGGVSFNGSANIDLSGVNTAGNQNTSGNAATATNATNLTGTSTANISSSALATGTADSTTYLRGDRTWQVLSVPTSPIPSGTVMLFVQTSAPTGWVKSTAHDNKALRVVSGTAGAGGSVAFTTAFANQTVSATVGGTTLATSQIPSHEHNIKIVTNGGDGGQTAIQLQPGILSTGFSGGLIQSTGGGGSHTHSFTGTAINLAVQYVDVIICTKS
jgi:hypothetical protein